MADKKIRKILKQLSAFAVAFAGLYYVLSSINISRTLNVIIEADYYFISASLIVLVVIYYLMSFRWRKVLEERSVNLKKWTSFRQIMVSNFVNTFAPARAGDIYRGYLSSNEERNSIETSILVLKERLMDVAVISVFLVLSLILFYPDNQILILPATMLLLLTAGYIVLRLIQRYESIPLKTLNSIYRKVRKALIENIRSDRWPLFIVLTSLIWLLGVLRTFFIFEALGMEISLAFVSIITFGWAIVAALPFSPSGIGTTEALIFFLLTEFGTGSANAGAFLLLNRVVLNGLPLTLGGFFYLDRGSNSTSQAQV